MSETNRILVSLLQEIRQKNLCVLIVQPSVYDIDKYVNLHRAKGVFHIHTDDEKNRGFYKFYGKEKLTYMIANMMKMRYRYPKAPNFKGVFTNWYPLGKEEYKAKKLKSLGDYAYKKKAEEGINEDRFTQLWRERYRDVLNYTKRHLKRSLKDICFDLGHNYKTAKGLCGSPVGKGNTNLPYGGEFVDNEADENIVPFVRQQGGEQAQQQYNTPKPKEPEPKEPQP